MEKAAEARETGGREGQRRREREGEGGREKRRGREKERGPAVSQ